MTDRKTIALILGIRPDVIRASLVLNGLRALDDIDVRFIWSGQHYSDNLKDVFFRELERRSAGPRARRARDNRRGGRRRT